MPRFVNLPTTSGNETSVRVDRVEAVSYGWDNSVAHERESRISETDSIIRTCSGDDIYVALPKPRVMELLGLHLANNGEEWV